MHYTNIFHTLLIWGWSQKRLKAFTMVELLLVIAVVGTLSAIAVPVYKNYIDDRRNETAILDIRGIEAYIVKFQAERGRPPDTLAEAGFPDKLDPWGHPYRYTRLAGLPKNEQDAKCRWDKYDKPLNYDFDLYSMGKDGMTMPKLTDWRSFDDIIRANGGAYVGLASEY